MAEPSTVPKAKRQRRSAEDARLAILESAEVLLMDGGPATLRLQRVARHAGISHPTLLHHFGSREGLVEALNERTAVELVSYIEALTDQTGPSRPDVIGHVFEKFRDGFAQRLIWLAMAMPGKGTRRGPVVDQMLDIMHRTRTTIAVERGHAEPAQSDTEFVFHLILVAAVGDALVGDAFRRPEKDSDHDLQRAIFIDRLRVLVRT